MSRRMDARIHRYDLFPDIEPYATGKLPVSDGHIIYWEQSGNPVGAPVVFLHGGPGAGAAAAHRRFFDPKFYRIVVFDQRGCGRSEPFGELANNTTDHLIADMEALRRHLDIDRWVLFGGSWGSTLALAYGIRHPHRCAGFVLRGIFLGTRREIDWFLDGMGLFFPEAHRAFREFLPARERRDVLGNYYRRLTDPEPLVNGPAAAAWSRYESACSNLIPKPEGPAGGLNGAALALARTEAHYFVHEAFLPPGALMENLGRIRRLPAVLVQGRYDMVCPIATADSLARAWHRADYVVVPDAGHSALEPGTRSVLVRAMEAMKARIR